MQRGADEAARPRKIGRPTLSDGQLLDIALDLFLNDGYEGTSVEAIALAAGMAKRTIYARYADKETLFRSALSRAIEDWIVPVERLQAAECDDLRETLRNVGGILVENILSPSGLRLFRLTNTVSSRMPELAAANVRQGTEPTVAFLTDLFARRVELSDRSGFDAGEAAHAFLHLVVGGPSSMAAWGVEFDAAELQRRTYSSIELFLNGLLPRPVPSEDTEEQNRRLRQMLTDALLENAVLREEMERRN
ncbi:TetR/AcrR family transcriptional regulator [Novosphingobium sp. TH158]|uniref:TetR/AcrR family transcriptional regulator n=1 Tax=Novosphingobium sp. TH158 TaxID=2067455 RepID=UPI0020B10B8E|nr:TetR/AcrR family transcriptional regulator [Novosphingobium sp. TH158]